MNNGTTIRELSSVGSERLPYKQRVGGSTPSAPTKKDLFRIPEEVFFYVYVPPECYGKSWGKSKTDQASNLRSCFELFEMFFEVKNQIADFGNVQNLQFAFFPLSSHIISIECKR